MTAVAEGAAVFAESIDWASRNRGRKSARGSISSGALNLSFNYISRTPDLKAKVVAKLGGQATNAEFQIDSLDTGWSSGRLKLRDGAAIDVPLAKPGENTFKIFVFDATGPVSLAQDKIVISRTAASVDAIPASHSIAVAAREKIGGPIGLVYLVKEGEQLPKKGTLKFRAEESLKAGSSGSLNFQLWEGDIVSPITDNRFIGLFKISGKDFEEGVIAAGEELVCEYEVLDSGNIVMEVHVKSIRGSFHSGRNFYSRQEGQIDFSNAAQLIEDQSKEVLRRLDDMSERIEDDRMDQAREKLELAESLKSGQTDPEVAKQAMDHVLEAKRLLALARNEHLKEIRQIELDRAIELFDKVARQHAKPSEESSFDSLVKTARLSIDRNTKDFEGHLDDLQNRSFVILWRQDWFIIDRFKWLAKAPHLFPDAREFTQLVSMGMEALKANDIEKLRNAVVHLDSIRIRSADDDDMMAGANIVRS